VACIEEPHTVHGARHTAGFRCINKQSRCKRPHEVFRSPWAGSAIWREWKHRHQNESKTSKQGNARINKVSAMRPGLAKIIEKVHISWYFESLETDLHMAENACCIDYAETWSSKQVYWLSKSQSPHCGTSDYRCEDTLELYTGVTRAGLLITGIHTWVATKSKMHCTSAKVQIDYGLRYVHTHTRAAHSKLPVDPCATRCL